MCAEKRLCPFCGKDITTTYRLTRIIPQEETIRREFSPGYTIGGNYLRETKYIRKFEALCCEECYDEYKKYATLTDRIAMFAIPIGLILGIAYCAYYRSTHNFEFGIGTFFHYLIWSLLGVIICSIPTMLVNILHRKKTSYKHAKECNANLE